MENSMRIVSLMMELQKAIKEAKQEYQRNGVRITDLHNQRTDAAHGIENCTEQDAMKRTIARCAFADRYAEVSRQRRELVNENATLEYAINNRAFLAELDLIIQQMTGQMQFLEHAVYHPRSSGGFYDEHFLAG